MASFMNLSGEDFFFLELTTRRNKRIKMEI